MAEIFSIALIWSTIRLSTPLILAALGGLFSERSGVINIALEGMMLAGAFTAAAVTHAAGNPFVGLLAGMVAGMSVAAIHAVACIRYRADQVVYPDDRHATPFEWRFLSVVRCHALDSQR